MPHSLNASLPQCLTPSLCVCVSLSRSLAPSLVSASLPRSVAPSGGVGYSIASLDAVAAQLRDTFRSR
jgi:hypothetical protein